jgi:hypothetical protein
MRDEEDVNGPSSLVPRPASLSTATVRLANATSEQAVVGGTVKLPSAGAIPPGMWFAPDPPGSEQIVAVYAPLRAVKGGWSGLTMHGWRRTERVWAGGSTTRDRLQFAVERVWFAAPGAADGLRLHVRIGAESFAEEGKNRLGFRYKIGRNPPMQVLDAAWRTDGGQLVAGLPMPQIQLMAPPRVARVSDLPEEIHRLGARAAHEWALAGTVHGVFHLLDWNQQRTPLGRGLRLLELPPKGGVSGALDGLLTTRFRVQIHRPLICDASTLAGSLGQAQAAAATFGLDMESDAVIEWWLEREGYDGALLAPDAHAHGDTRMAIVFRRNQIAQVSGLLR